MMRIAAPTINRQCRSCFTTQASRIHHSVVSRTHSPYFFGPNLSSCMTRKMNLLRGRVNQQKLNFSTTDKSSPPKLTPRQLQAYFFTCAVPMLGFGFMDNTITIQAGNYIDCTIGVALGISTLAAAACGQIVAGACSVLFGESLQQLFRKSGMLPTEHIKSSQLRLPKVQRIGLAGSFLGVVIGATLGLVNLALIDTNQSSILKLEALTKEQEFAFQIEVSNSERPDATTITVRGPDVDGILASMTAALTQYGCSLIELHACPKADNQGLDNGTFQNVFVIRPRGSQGKKQQIEDGDLQDLGQLMLAACKDPLSAHTLKEKVHDLEDVNLTLMERVQELERAVEDRQVCVVPSTGVDEQEREKEEDRQMYLLASTSIASENNDKQTSSIAHEAQGPLMLASTRTPRV